MSYQSGFDDEMYAWWAKLGEYDTNKKAKIVAKILMKQTKVGLTLGTNRLLEAYNKAARQVFKKYPEKYMLMAIEENKSNYHFHVFLHRWCPRSLPLPSTTSLSANNTFPLSTTPSNIYTHSLATNLSFVA